jgi:transposase-like protein
MSNYKDSGEKSNESTSEVSASFTCQDCGKTFNSRQELKEHTHN